MRSTQRVVCSCRACLALRLSLWWPCRVQVRWVPSSHFMRREAGPSKGSSEASAISDPTCEMHAECLQKTFLLQRLKRQCASSSGCQLGSRLNSHGSRAACTTSTWTMVRCDSRSVSSLGWNICRRRLRRVPHRHTLQGCCGNCGYCGHVYPPIHPSRSRSAGRCSSSVGICERPRECRIFVTR